MTRGGGGGGGGDALVAVRCVVQHLRCRVMRAGCYKRGRWQQFKDPQPPCLPALRLTPTAIANSRLHRNQRDDTCNPFPTHSTCRRSHARRPDDNFHWRLHRRHSFSREGRGHALRLQRRRHCSRQAARRPAAWRRPGCGGGLLGWRLPACLWVRPVEGAAWHAVCIPAPGRAGRQHQLQLTP